MIATVRPVFQTFSLHAALPISRHRLMCDRWIFLSARVKGADANPVHLSMNWIRAGAFYSVRQENRSEEHTSELQSPYDRVCRPTHEKIMNLAKTRENTWNRTSN